MNKALLKVEVQKYIKENENTDIGQIALGKSPFLEISSAELANQIKSRKQAKGKLPTWYSTENIIFPPYLSMEQCSAESIAEYKAILIPGQTILDLTAGFGVDSTCFAQAGKKVIAIEQQINLVEIAQHNALQFNLNNIKFYSGDSISFLEQTKDQFDTVYIDPARRLAGKKVFQLIDCEPNIIKNLNLILSKTANLWVKTAPFLDIQAGLQELKAIQNIHILSLKNECKELLWEITHQATLNEAHIVCHCIGPKTIKKLSIPINKLSLKIDYQAYEFGNYLYEPDVGLLKSGAFNFIAEHFDLKKLEKDSHLYWGEDFKAEFPGRIFKIEAILHVKDLKKEKLIGNVLVRNYPDKAENLVRKYHIKSHNEDFIIFTQDVQNKLILKAKIIQHY